MADQAAAPKAVVDGKRAGRGLGEQLRKRWRGWLRAIHRDVGYLLVGLTVIYACSGLAINHIDDWDPNYVTYTREHELAPIDLDTPDEQAVAAVRAALKLEGTPRSAERVAPDQVEISYDYRRYVVDLAEGLAFEEGREPRFFLRVANWLHYNRGKAAWTYIADAYAVLLLYLAISGLFMIKGKLGLRWRGLILVGLGAAVPLLYVTLSGGPAGQRSKPAAAAAAPAAGE